MMMITMLLNIQVVERYAHKAWPAPLFIQTWAQHPISHLIMFAPFSNIYTPQYCTITSHVEDTSLSNVPSLKEALFKPTVDTTKQDIQTKLRCLSSFNILKCSNLYPYLLCKHILFFSHENTDSKAFCIKSWEFRLLWNRDSSYSCPCSMTEFWVWCLEKCAIGQI